MGLTIHYDLKMPGDTPVLRVVELMTNLREHALTLSLDRVTEVFELPLSDVLAKRPFSWTSIDDYFHASAQCNLTKDDESLATRRDQRGPAIIGFGTHPGHGCEAALFALMPPALTPRPEGLADDTPWDCWFWSWFCKTQYASVVSDDNLLKCHLAVIELLEEARRLGAEIEVHDETGYWEHRSTEQLIREVTRMNGVVAKVAGALHDAMPSPPGSHRVEGSIFEHPDFERLETRPLDSDDS